MYIQSLPLTKLQALGNVSLISISALIQDPYMNAWIGNLNGIFFSAIYLYNF